MPISTYTQAVGDAWRSAGDFASGLVTPTLKLGVTGLARSGKTVFITALVHNLMAGARLPFFEAAAQGGATCTCNIAPLCRGHHRLKTQTAWRHLVLGPGSYLWTSPHGYRFVRDQDGTRDVTPAVRPKTNGCLYPVPSDPDPPDSALTSGRGPAA